MSETIPDPAAPTPEPVTAAEPTMPTAEPIAAAPTPQAKPPPVIPVLDAPSLGLGTRRRAHRKRVVAHKARLPQQATAPRMHEHDPQEAMQTAAAVRDEDNEPVTRRSREDRDVNRFAIPRRFFRPGWDLEWKTITVLGDPVSASTLLDVHEAGWRPERAKDWKNYVPTGTPDMAPIELDGQRLYGRSRQFTMDAKAEDERIAQRQMRDRMQASQEGRLVRGNEAGLADMPDIVRSVPLGVSVEGETGVGERMTRR